MDTTREKAHGREAERPGGIPAKGWRDILARVLAEIKQDHVSIVAAGVGFYAFLALFPALIALITIYGLMADPATVQQQVTSMTTALSPEVARLVTQPLTHTATREGLDIGLVASLAGVLWSASGGVNGLMEGLNIVYDEPGKRTFLKKRGLALLLTLGAIVFVIIAVALVAVVPIVLDVVRLGTFVTVTANVLRWPLLALLLMSALGVVYKVGPDRDNPQFRWVSWGAVIATVLWLIVSGLFSMYVNNFGKYDRIYGALAGVIVLMLWLYLSAFTVLLGAEINSEMEAQTRKDTTVGEERPMGQRHAVKADELGPSASGE